MLKLYEYAQEIEDLLEIAIDEETGEIFEDELLARADALQMERRDKLLSMAALYKSRKAELAAFNAEISVMKTRRDAVANSMASLKKYMAMNMAEGEKLKDQRASVYWSTSTSVALDVAPEKLPKEFQRVTVEANKTALKDYLQKGAEIPGATLETKTGLAIR